MVLAANLEKGAESEAVEERHVFQVEADVVAIGECFGDPFFEERRRREVELTGDMGLVAEEIKGLLEPDALRRDVYGSMRS